MPKDPDCTDCEDKVIMDEKVRLYEEKIGELREELCTTTKDLKDYIDVSKSFSLMKAVVTS